MTINFGKRNPGGLTATSPGDTIYVPFATYNDSGASIGIGGTFAETDIEIFKNGVATPRATDSGYSLISDTGQYGDLLGLHRFSIQIFNTADDTGFYDVGSHYHVAVDSITVDGRTVRFFPAIFEIGTPPANVVAFSDTGVNNRLAKIQSDVDTGLRAQLAVRDTGAIATAVWAKDVRTLTGWAFDTGVQQAIARLDTGISETIDRILSDTDTGIQPLTAAQVADAVWDELDTGHLDTGTFGRLSPRLTRAAFDVDTGLRNLALTSDQIANAVWDELDTGHLDTGTFGRLSPRLAKAAADLDTGEPNANVTSVNSISVGGSGTSGDPWGP